MTCALLAVMLGLVNAELHAQQADSLRAGATALRSEVVDTSVRRSPISPRRAFLRSLILPGWGQTSLGRGTAGGLFVLMEGVTAAMIVKSRDDLGRAKNARSDSLFQGFQLNATTGELELRDGRPIPIYLRNPLTDRIPARRQHLEDWIALMAFNHLFAGAEAFVAAHLYDVPARVSLLRAGNGVAIAARFAW
ncbi:MAG: hypothetical protein H7Z74_15485 [Anaerolineae bacterium]|nr:hypothetical protein [Gemmatimonadaceae bacterium]